MNNDNLEYWFNNLRKCLTINNLLGETSDKIAIIDLFERDGLDAIFCNLVSHEINVEEQYLRFKGEVERNMGAGNGYAKFLNLETKRLQIDADTFSGKMGFAYDISPKKIQQDSNEDAFEYLPHDINIMAFSVDSETPGKGNPAALRYDCICYLLAVVRKTVTFLENQLIIHDFQESPIFINQTAETFTPNNLTSTNKIQWNLANRVLYDLFGQLLIMKIDGIQPINYEKNDSTIKYISQMIYQYFDFVKGKPTLEQIERELQKMVEANGPGAKRNRIDITIDCNK